MDNKSQNILITGAAGLIGHEVLNLLTSEAEGSKGRVGTVWALTHRDQVSPTKTLRPAVMDLSKSFDKTVLPPKIGAIIHLAQSAHFREFPDKAQEIFDVNVRSTLQLLNYAREAGAKTFILASSGGIYGYGDEEFSEESQIQSQGDLGFYLGTKLCSEILAQDFAAYMNVIVLRFFFVYGPRQKKNMLVPRLIDSVKSGNPITLQGNEGIRINPIYVSDAALAVTKALDVQGYHRINVAGAEPMSLREIGQKIGLAFNREPKFEIQNSNPKHLVADIRKMTRVLNEPKVKFDHALRFFK